MGLLDDAIREHLELKRLKGADPAEVAREERDALGPVRRETEPVDVADLDGEERSQPPAGDKPDRVEDRPADQAVGQETLEINMEAELHGGDESSVDEPSEGSGRARSAPVGHPAHTQTDAQDSLEWEMPGDREMAEPSDLAAAQDTGDPESEDVLEETPDFLRETPEHERLWFEQRPPRDFDFNE